MEDDPAAFVLEGDEGMVAGGDAEGALCVRQLERNPTNKPSEGDPTEGAWSHKSHTCPVYDNAASAGDSSLPS